jgi:hypothetical protein
LRALLCIVSAWLLAAAGALAQGEGTPPRPTPPALVGHGQLRVVHAWAGVRELVVSVDGQYRGSAFAYGADSGYIALPEGAHAVALSESLTPTAPLLSTTVEITAGTARTLVASRELSAPLVLDDLGLAQVGGPAIVRFVHAAGGLPALELAGADGARLAGPVEFGAASRYVDVAPSAFTLSARLAATGAPVAAIPGAVLVADSSYTFVAVGAAGSGPVILHGLVDD